MKGLLKVFVLLLIAYLLFISWCQRRLDFVRPQGEKGGEVISEAEAKRAARLRKFGSEAKRQQIDTALGARPGSQRPGGSLYHGTGSSVP